MIRFSHSVFALPFALLALVLAAGGWPSARVLVLVVVAMVAARSAAMAFNRIVDRDVDARNPRTAGRHLVAGTLSVGYAKVFTVLCVAVFVGCAALLNRTALLLSPAVLVVLLGYSYLKRFSAAAHFGVGLALGLSPLGAWVAGAGGLVGDLRVPLALGLAVLLWVAGFDVIYACQDAEVDRREGLHSIPARLGIPGALRVALACHVVCIAAFVAVAWLAGLRWPYLGAVGVAAALLAYEHAIVSPTDLTRVNVAFFNVNGIVALLVGAAGIADVLAR
ncbi:MAG: UbiA family prenyltransferase [Planctomycetia bacterium]|nr:UbiA family prenyltransferase [Planctomycetia bacterium]